MCRRIVLALALLLAGAVDGRKPKAKKEDRGVGHLKEDEPYSVVVSYERGIIDHTFVVDFSTRSEAMKYLDYIVSAPLVKKRQRMRMLIELQLFARGLLRYSYSDPPYETNVGE